MTSGRSRCMVLEAPGRLVPRTFELPRIGADEGLLHVEMAGICHTDVELFRGNTVYASPLILGHEIVGRIDQIGETAARRWGVKVGDRVAVESIVRCGFCRACVRGSYKYCTEKRAYGTFTSCDQPPHLWGSYSEYLYLAPGALVHRVPDGMSPEVATLLTVAIANGIQWTVDKAGTGLGDVVVVQGCGPIGLSCAAAAHEAGADLVVVTGVAADTQRLRLAREFGADVTVQTDQQNLAEVIADLTGGELADRVIDTTGSGPAIVTSTEIVRPQGTVVNGGVTGDQTLTSLRLDRLLYREVRLQHVFAYEHEAVRRAMRLVAKGRYPFEKLITHRFGLLDAEQAIRVAARELPGEQPLKVAIVP